MKPYHYLPVLLETQSPHYSAFLTIKPVKKANFPLLSFWIRYISCQVSHPIHLKPFHYLPVLLETHSPCYSAFLTMKLVKKVNFPPFEPLKSSLPGPRSWKAKAIGSGHSFWANFLGHKGASGEQFFTQFSNHLWSFSQIGTLLFVHETRANSVTSEHLHSCDKQYYCHVTI